MEGRGFVIPMLSSSLTNKSWKNMGIEAHAAMWEYYVRPDLGLFWCNRGGNMDQIKGEGYNARLLPRRDRAL